MPPALLLTGRGIRQLASSVTRVGTVKLTIKGQPGIQRRVGRTGKAVLSGYFGLLVVFLYAPLIVLLVFAFNKGNIPTLPIKSRYENWALYPVPMCVGSTAT